jgi:two-component system, chemotaxis family, protein-glutamate methylesterase/glutaminase
VDPKVNYSRPSVDVLFESAAFVYAGRCIGIVLTGANRDGAKGLAKIKSYGGLAIVQDPASAEFPAMPAAARQEVEPDYLLSLEQIGLLLRELGRELQHSESGGGMNE